MDHARAQGNTRGILAMIAAMASFTATDSLMKLATASIPPSQIITVRGIMATALMYLYLRALGPVGDLRHLMRWPILRRAGFEILFITTYVTALSRAPFADVFSVLQSGPILITVFAALVWKERVGWQRWAAVFVGFIGVSMIVKPAPQSFDPAMGLALIAALMASGRDLATRAMPPGTPSSIVTLSATGGMAIGGAFLAPFETWQPISPFVWGVLAAAAIAVALGSHFLIMAYRSAETSAVAPFRFASVPFAILVGWAIWSQAPDAVALTGIGIVVGSGLFMMYRERASRLGRG